MIQTGTKGRQRVSNRQQSTPNFDSREAAPEQQSSQSLHLSLIKQKYPQYLSKMISIYVVTAPGGSLEQVFVMNLKSTSSNLSNSLIGLQQQRNAVSEQLSTGRASFNSRVGSHGLITRLKSDIVTLDANIRVNSSYISKAQEIGAELQHVDGQMHRLRELALTAASSTLGEDERKALQSEFQARISDVYETLGRTRIPMEEDAGASANSGAFDTISKAASLNLSDIGLALSTEEMTVQRAEVTFDKVFSKATPVKSSEYPRVVEHPNIDVPGSPDLIPLPDGNSVLLYAKDQKVFFQKLDGNGQLLGAAVELANNNSPSPVYTHVRGALLKDGKIAVTWDTGTSHTIDNSEVKMSLLDQSGNILASNINVSTSGRKDQHYQQIVATKDGGFLVVWHERITYPGQTFSNGHPKYDTLNIHFQKYDADGVTIGSNVTFGAVDGGHEQVADIAELENGNFVISGQTSLQFETDRGIDEHQEEAVLQVYNSDGQRIGSEVRINDYNQGSQRNARVAALKNGGFVATFSDGAQQKNFAQIYDNEGNPIGSNIEIAYGGAPDVIALEDGGFVIHSVTLTGNQFQQRFNAGGEQVGSEFQRSGRLISGFDGQFFNLQNTSAITKFDYTELAKRVSLTDVLNGDALIDISTQEAAQMVLAKIDNGQTAIQSSLSELGAVENNLLSNIDAMTSTRNQTSDSLSAHLDTDFAEGITKNAKVDLLASTTIDLKAIVNEQQLSVLKLINSL